MLAIVAPLVIIAIAIIFMFKRVDVRLSLGLCATGLFLISGKFPQLFVIIAQQMANEKTVVPICSAMGFAYVLKLTECDRHLTHLLLTPLRYGRWLLIPGGIAAAYIVNMAIVSQSSTAAIVGTVLLPLLQAVGIMPIIAGSLLLLGSSMGGELFNPGAVEMVKLAELTGKPVATLVAQVMPVNLLASLTTLIVFCLLAVILSQKTAAELGRVGSRGEAFGGQFISCPLNHPHFPENPTPPAAPLPACGEGLGERFFYYVQSTGLHIIGEILVFISKCFARTPFCRQTLVEDTKTESAFAESEKPFRLNLIKAIVPLLPLALLFIVPALVQLPKEFSNNSVSIAAAMLIGVTAAGLTAPKESVRLPAVFFEGAGFAYANIISLIIVATIFTEGIKANGLIEIMTNALANRPLEAKFASLILPFTLAGVTGSGSAPAIAVMNVLVPAAATMNLDPVQVGALVAVAAQLGRTMSPVAAVVIMSSTISQQSPLNLVKCVAIPLLAGEAALLVAALLNLV